MLEVALAHIAPPDILHDDDIAAVDVAAQIAFLKPLREASGTIGPAAVRRTKNDDGGFAGRLGRIDRRVEGYAVTHCDAVLGLVVQLGDGLPGKGRNGGEQAGQQEREKSTDFHSRKVKVRFRKLRFFPQTPKSRHERGVRIGAARSH